MRYSWVIAIVLLGLVIGFLGGSYLFGRYDGSWVPGRVAYRFASITGHNPAISFAKGWGIFDDGLWLTKSSGDVNISLGRRPRSALTLSLSASADFSTSPLKKRQVEVFANEVSIGAFVLSSQKPEQKELRMLIPQKLALKSQVMKISFQLQSSLPGRERILMLDGLALLDVFGLGDMKGFVDLCSPTKISGWAASGNAATPVTIKRNGKTIGTVRTFHDRPDLPQQGLPLHAGFTFVFSKLPDRGDHVEVVFLNGKSLSGQSCRF